MLLHLGPVVGTVTRIIIRDEAEGTNRGMQDNTKTRSNGDVRCDVVLSVQLVTTGEPMSLFPIDRES